MDAHDAEAHLLIQPAGPDVAFDKLQTFLHDELRQAGAATEGIALQISQSCRQDDLFQGRVAAKGTLADDPQVIRQIQFLNVAAGEGEILDGGQGAVLREGQYCQCGSLKFSSGAFPY